MAYQRTAAHQLGDHAFGRSAPFRIGVEEELFLVDRRSLRVAPRTDEVLARRPPRKAHGAIVGELCDGVIELTTPICANAGQARGVLAQLRDVAVGAATSLMGVGVHPTAAFGDVRHRAGRHYRRVSEGTRSLLRQSIFCGVHVHVGMPDPETAVAAFNGMRKWAPLLQALAANSPFWYGRDSGLASCRTVLFHSVPRTGMPRAFEDWSDVLQTLDELCAAAEVDGTGSVWWDMRPHAALGTLELRLLDAQSRLDDLTGLIALVHCLVLHEALTRDTEHPSTEVLGEASFRAVRDGLDARVPFRGRMRHVHDLAASALDLARGYAHELGCEDELDEVRRMLERGNGAARQREAHARGGIPALLRRLAAETSEHAAEASRPTVAPPLQAPALEVV
jgi:carboxylate-amine ligase